MKPTNLKLETLKPGDPVTILRRVGDAWKPFGSFHVIDRHDKTGYWRYARAGSANIYGAFPPGGGCWNFMSHNPEPDYYVSANPAHVRAGTRAAEVSAKRAAREKSSREAKESTALAAFQKELSALCRKYQAEIYPVQVSGDDQGVEIETRVSIGQSSRTLEP